MSALAEILEIAGAVVLVVLVVGAFLAVVVLVAGAIGQGIPTSSPAAS